MGLGTMVEVALQNTSNIPLNRTFPHFSEKLDFAKHDRYVAEICQANRPVRTTSLEVVVVVFGVFVCL